MIFEKGQQVRFKPGCVDDYSLSGVEPGDYGFVKEHLNGDPNADVIVDFIRNDGTVCEDFYAFPGDLEVVDE